MADYLFIKTEGNGYYCSCCRREDSWTEEETFDSDSEAIEFIRKFNEDNQKKNDIRIDEAYRIEKELDF